MGVLPTVVGPEQTWVMEQEVKGAKECVSPLEEKPFFFSEKLQLVFFRSKEVWGVTSNFGSASYEPVIHVA